MEAGGPDPLAELKKRAAVPRESEDFDPYFDWDAEVAALKEVGYVFPSPAVDRALEVAARVRTLGYEGAERTLVAPLKLPNAEEDVLWWMVDRALGWSLAGTVTWLRRSARPCEHEGA